MLDSTTSAAMGTVVSVRGDIVDVQFATRLPPINSRLRAGKDAQVVIEVWAQLDARRIRGITMTPTRGLARGMLVQATGGPLKAPVGKAIRSVWRSGSRQDRIADRDDS
jgi:F-type H+/Na+-transporting ATPase subunit beta